MRNMKCRAWDVKEKRMLDINHWTINMLNENDENFKIMESIGYCDKEGKEIYVGDYFFTGSLIFIVVWDDIKKRFCLNHRGCNDDGLDLLVNNLKIISIYSNIYENPIEDI